MDRLVLPQRGRDAQFRVDQKIRRPSPLLPESVGPIMQVGAPGRRAVQVYVPQSKVWPDAGRAGRLQSLMEDVLQVFGPMRKFSPKQGTVIVEQEAVHRVANEKDVDAFLFCCVGAVL